MRWVAPPWIAGSEMPWPFSRNEPDPADKDAGEGGGRRAQASDPAAELRAQTRRRLLGAAALLGAAVIVLPMLLDSAPRPVRDDVSITIANAPVPPPAAQPPVEQAAAAPDKAAEAVPLPKDAAPAAAEPPAKAGKAPLARASTPPPPPAEPAALPAQPAAPPAQPPAATTTPAERFAVQVAALSTATAAGELIARLKQDGFSAYAEQLSTADSTLHRVRVGPFPSREEAQRAVEKLRAAGHKAAVVGG